MRYLLSRSVVLALLLFSLTLAGVFAADKPNILFLLSDDHSYPYLGCYGDPNVRTPNLDRLAAEGMRFDNMYVSCPQCVPSRAALMTGQSPVAVRMVRFTSPLPPNVSALPDLLKSKAGYFTGVGGRTYHLDGPGAGKGAKAANEIDAILSKHQLRTFKDRLDYVGPLTPRDFPKIVGDFLAAVPQGKPWFFWLGFSDPHHVWDADASPLGLPDANKLTLPAHYPDLPGMRSDFAKYLGEIERLDRDVQSVLDLLKARGLAENTVVVFMGDNGMAQPHGKGYLYDPGIHVPLLVRWPGTVKPGGVTQQLVSGEDFAPTMLEIAGAAPTKEMSGQSYVKLLRGQPFEGRKYIFAERGPHGGDAIMRPDIPASSFDLSRCVRSDKFKLIYNCTPHQRVQPVDSAQDPGWKAIVAAHDAGKLLPQHEKAYFTATRPTFELYDLTADPSELNNVIGDAKYAAVELDLKRALTEKMILDWDFLPLPLK
jgi:N-sulfoglucosamine sulfohydrolase